MTAAAVASDTSGRRVEFFHPFFATLMIIRALLLSLLLTSCANNYLVGFGGDTNYLSFDHPNSEEAVADVRAAANKLCRQRKELAIETESTCSLTRCATNYQCQERSDAGN